jgi:RNA polymerase sigma-70 factor (ECF subfamily)
MCRVRAHDDETAFSELTERWEVPIQRLCMRMLGDPHYGQDIAQETFIRVFAKRREYEAKSKFSTWIWRIALNLCYDELRRRARRAESSLATPGEDSGETEIAAAELAPDEVLAGSETGERVRRALMALSETYRAVLVLRHYQDLKFREIAAVLGIPEGTVKSRMAEALSQMNRLLSRGEAGTPGKAGNIDKRPRETLML